MLVDRLLDRPRDIRGVEAITAGQCTPFGSRCARLGFSIEGRPETLAEPLPTGWHRVGPDHFAALAFPIVRGRGFTADDRRGRPRRRHQSDGGPAFFSRSGSDWPSHHAAGSHRWRSGVAEIVGVVGDVIYWPLGRGAGAGRLSTGVAVQLSLHDGHGARIARQWRRSMFGPSSGQPMFDTLRRALAGIDPNLPMFDA